MFGTKAALHLPCLPYASYVTPHSRFIALARVLSRGRADCSVAIKKQTALMTYK